MGRRSGTLEEWHYGLVRLGMTRECCTYAMDSDPSAISDDICDAVGWGRRHISFLIK